MACATASCASTGALCSTRPLGLGDLRLAVRLPSSAAASCACAWATAACAACAIDRAESTCACGIASPCACSDSARARSASARLASACARASEACAASNLRVRARDRRRGARELRLRRREAALRRRRDDPDLRVGRLGLRLRRRKLGLRLLGLRREVRRIDLDEEIALLHQLIVDDVHLGHRAPDTRRDHDGVGLDLSVVGALFAAGDPLHRPVYGEADGDERADDHVRAGAVRLGRDGRHGSRPFGGPLGNGLGCAAGHRHSFRSVPSVAAAPSAAGESVSRARVRLLRASSRSLRPESATG